MEVVQYIKDTYHDGKCEIAAIGKLNLSCVLRNAIILIPSTLILCCDVSG